MARYPLAGCPESASCGCDLWRQVAGADLSSKGSRKGSRFDFQQRRTRRDRGVFGAEDMGVNLIRCGAKPSTKATSAACQYRSIMELH